VNPSVPAGFTLSVYAELPAPRMMVYAPNGDLFVSSPGTNTITVLRDANNDGTFEARETYAGGAPPARGGPPAGGGGGGGGRAAGRAAGGPPPGFGQPPCSARRISAGVHATAYLRREGTGHDRGAVRASRSTTAISMSATPVRSFDTSTRTAI
jgi:hypothetical protein